MTTSPASPVFDHRAPYELTWRQRSRVAVQDLAMGLGHWRLWGFLGWQDLRQRYRRSVIGPFWITISTGVFVAALGWVYAGLFGIPIDEYLPYLAAGVLVWNLISGLLIESTTVFTAALAFVLNLPGPLSVYVWRLVWRSLLLFVHNLAVWVVVVIWFKVPLNLYTLLFIPGMVLVTLIGAWAALVLGILSTRYRDIPNLVVSGVQILFFVTPVFWQISTLPDRAMLLALNPVYHMVEVIRAPMLGEAAPLSSWLWCIAMAVVGWFIAIPFFGRYRFRVAYWM